MKNNNRQLLREDYRHLQKEDYDILQQMNMLSPSDAKIAQEYYNNYINADSMEKRNMFRNKWIEHVKLNIDSEFKNY